jgi:hypothetical protein
MIWVNEYVRFNGIRDKSLQDSSRLAHAQNDAYKWADVKRVRKCGFGRAVRSAHDHTRFAQAANFISAVKISNYESF